jgi:O-acetyl-ADP-ribose deacetylase (regulator of RNase III)
MSYICKIKEGDLLQEINATFIVNASNTRLILGTGVSMAFKKHCGAKLQQEMVEVYQSVEKPIEQGTVFATSAGGATNFKCTILI